MILHFFLHMWYVAFEMCEVTMIAGLFFFLVLAVILDLRTYRIPNALTMAGMAVGVIYQLYRAGPPGMFRAVKDLIGSILILFPLYMIRCLGAGDIKLLSVVTIFLGWKQGMMISIYSLFAGAAMGMIKGSILFALRRKKSIKNLGKGVLFYSAGKAAKTTFLTDISFKKIKKGVDEHLQKNYIWFLRNTKADKNRQKKDHIEQIRTANQLKDSNKKDQIGEINQNYYCLSQINKANLLNYNSQKFQFGATNQNSITNQLRHKKKTGDQGCVIHYSIAILIAFLVTRMS